MFKFCSPKLGSTRRGIIKAVSRLEGAGYFTIERRGKKKGDQGRRHEDLTNIYRPIMVNDGLPIKTETVNGGSNNGKQGAPVTVKRWVTHTY